MEEEIFKRAQDWVNNSDYSAVLRQEIKDLIDEDNKDELIDRFYKDIEFGTGGIRGVVGAGSNRLNIFNICKVTQGISNYVLGLKLPAQSAVIGFDCRLSSVEFAKATAEVLAANGLVVHFFNSTHPTPLISYAVRHLKTTIGIVITASHNPPDYNGYKVYWSDGCQVTAPNDEGMINCIKDIKSAKQIKKINWNKGLQQNLINIIPTSVDDAYYQQVMELLTDDYNPNFKKGILYTPLHGVGYFMVKELLSKRGFINFSTVKSQQTPDGNFPTLKSPNPEDPDSMREAIKISQANDYVILATDPDADRLGVMIKENGQWQRLDGNQIGQLFIYFWLSFLRNKGEIIDKGFIVSTIVSSRLGQKIAADFGVSWHETLTGFKNIGRKTNELIKKGHKFLFAYEESFGYQFGDYIREKDGISASLFFAEMFRYYDQQEKTIGQVLAEIYEKYGYHTDHLLNKVIPGKDGAEIIKKIMVNLRDNPPLSLAGHELEAVYDYKLLLADDKKNLQQHQIAAEMQSDVLSFYFDDGTRVSARPSGTEPKIKFYFNLAGSSKEETDNLKQAYVNDFSKIIEGIIENNQ